MTTIIYQTHSLMMTDVHTVNKFADNEIRFYLLRDIKGKFGVYIQEFYEKRLLRAGYIADFDIVNKTADLRYNSAEDAEKAILEVNTAWEQVWDGLPMYKTMLINGYSFSDHVHVSILLDEMTPDDSLLIYNQTIELDEGVWG